MLPPLLFGSGTTSDAPPARSPIAVIGLACHLPGAHDPEAFFRLLLDGERRFAPLPAEVWAPEVHATDLPEPLRGETLHGALLDEVPYDGRSLRMPPVHVEKLHRMEKVALLTMCEALRDAGIRASDGPQERARVIVASTTLGRDARTDHGRRLRHPEFVALTREVLGEQAPQVQERVLDRLDDSLGDAPTIESESMRTSASLIAGRVANLYDLRGGHMAIDAGASSSLAALDEAVRGLESGAFDLAVVCAISPRVSPSWILAAAHDGYLGGERPRPFAPDAAGTVLGEGCVAVVLARVEDTDGRRVRACIEGVAGARADGQRGAEAIEVATRDAAVAACRAAGCRPTDIGFIESTACGRAELDEAERRGLAAATGDPDVRRRLDSTVANVGFLHGASGMVALLKAILAVSRGVWPSMDGVEGAARPVEIPAASRRVGVSDVGSGGTAFHAVIGPPPRTISPVARRLRTRHDEPIAIVGCGLLMPGACDPGAFWRNVVERVDAITELPRSRWDVDRIMPEAAGRGRAPIAGVIDLPRIDPARHGIHDLSADALDPETVLGLVVGEQALADAGLDRASPALKRAAVVFGQLPLRTLEVGLERRALFAEHLAVVAALLREAGVAEHAIGRLRAAARAAFERRTGAFPLAPGRGFTGVTVAERVAGAFGLGGGALSVDAACASSLAAVQLAALRLQRGEVDVALAGGVAYNLVPEYYAVLGLLGVLSESGVPPFLPGSGFVPAEGAGAVVLKRLSDAERDGDRVYAVLRGIGTSSDGRGASALAPSAAGQALAMRRALAAAHVPPDGIDLIEAHGTGTDVGDVTEMASYAAVYGQRDRSAPLTVGTVKSQIGHLSAAAGVAGLIKAALALHERVLPPSLSDRDPKPELGFGTLPFELGNQARPWIVPPSRTRRAGVSAFGIGGVNYHAILEEPSRSAARHDLDARLAHPACPPARENQAERFEVELTPLSLPDRPRRFSFRDRHVVVVMDARGVGHTLATRLEERGARVSRLSGEGEADALAAELASLAAQRGPIDGVIDLSAFDDGAELVDAPAGPFMRALHRQMARTFAVARHLYARLEEAGPHGACFVVVTAMGGRLGLEPVARGNLLGASMLGFAKGLKQELPHVVVKGLDFDFGEAADTLVCHLLREVEDGNDRMEVGYGPVRLVPNLVRRDIAADAPVARRFGRGDVFLFSGGGRGVAFECAVALARLGVAVVTTGRTELPDPAQPWISLDDAAFDAFRKEEFARQRAEDPRLTPARFERRFDALARQRELHRNLERARRLALPITYEVCDITDGAGVRALAERVRVAHGRIDGIAHAAMVEWSKSLPTKTPQEVERTMETKVSGLLNLLEATRGDALSTVVSFGSGAGRFGSAGQTDYSAANAQMAAVLVAECARRVDPVHHVTMDWTGWSDVGIAASGDIARLLRASGLTFIRPEEGTFLFLREMMLGHAPEVVIFGQRMMYETHLLGPEVEGSGERSLVLDDHGRPLVPSHWPMVDVVERHGPGSVTVRRRLDLGSDFFLTQHRLYGVPILPATFGCELLAEAAALTSPGFHVERIEGFRIDVPVKLHHDRPFDLRVDARVVEERAGVRVVEVASRSDLRLHGEVIQADRLHHQARVLLRCEMPPASPVVVPDLKGAAHARSFFHMARHPIHIGQLFSRAELLRLGDGEIVGHVRPPRHRDITGRGAHHVFQVDPLLLDTAFQIAASLDGYENGFVHVPNAVTSVTIGRRPRPDERARVHARLIRDDGPDVFFDVRVAGEGDALLMDVAGLHFIRIAHTGEER